MMASKAREMHLSHSGRKWSLLSPEASGYTSLGRMRLPILVTVVQCSSVLFRGLLKRDWQLVTSGVQRQNKMRDRWTDTDWVTDAVYKLRNERMGEGSGWWFLPLFTATSNFCYLIQKVLLLIHFLHTYSFFMRHGYLTQLSPTWYHPDQLDHNFHHPHVTQPVTKGDWNCPPSHWEVTRLQTSDIAYPMNSRIKRGGLNPTSMNLILFTKW